MRPMRQLSVCSSASSARALACPLAGPLAHSLPIRSYIFVVFGAWARYSQVLLFLQAFLRYHTQVHESDTYVFISFYKLPCGIRPQRLSQLSQITMFSYVFVSFPAVYPTQTPTTKAAAAGRQHKNSGAAFGRATSFVVSFGLVLNVVNIVAVTTIIVLHAGNGCSEHV